MKKINLLILVMSIFMIDQRISLLLAADNLFNDIWHQAQQDYILLQQSRLYSHALLYTNKFYDDLSNKVEALINNAPSPLFLKKSFITPIMVRADVDHVETAAIYEETFLKECLSFRTKQAVSKFKESTHELLDDSCKSYNCSSTSLVHLFYVAKILESYGANPYPELILDIGGGFGNVAKCFKQILPNSTVVILDLPQINIIQKIYLNYTAPDIKVVLHSDDNLLIEKNAINLVPLYLLEHLQIEPDLLTSTFALSESPVSMQKFVINRNFFKAKKIYISGQMNGWKDIGFDWIVEHNLIIDAIRNIYTNVTCAPMHICKKNFLSYDIIAS